MGQVVGVFATSHSPGITGFPEKAPDAARQRVEQAFTRARRAIQELEPDVIVAISVEHFTNFFMSNLPVFSIVTGRQFDVPATDEMAAFLRIPRHLRPGHPALGEAVRLLALADGFDPSLVAGDFQWDENFSVPLQHLDPDVTYPVLPVIVNAVTKPMPTLRRCFAFGQMLRRALEAQTIADRVVVLGTGGLSHWVGTPESGTINTDFDNAFLDAFAAGDHERLLTLTDEQIDVAGNGAHEIRTWLMAAGAAADSTFQVLAYEPVPAWLTGVAVVCDTASVAA